tara:strand:+ start:303 stop:665 length:363 start_codon:yes stop_codon:yes gene_type:complete
MNKYIKAIREYFKSKSYYIYEDPRTGEIFTYKRQGVYRKNGRVLVLVSKGNTILSNAGAGPMEKYVFSDKNAAIKKSEEIGMGGAVHRAILGDESVVYIPGETEEQFELWYKKNHGEDSK